MSPFEIKKEGMLQTNKEFHEEHIPGWEAHREKKNKNQRLRIRKIRSNNLINSEISYNVSNCMAQKKINP